MNIFQSTHPTRGATFRRLRRVNFQVISIHAPYAGCDQNGQPRIRSRSISIHAPYAGCDWLYAVPTVPFGNFNPRTLRGVRRKYPIAPKDVFTFQSTHPTRGATRVKRCNSVNRQFQSTHPTRGATFYFQYLSLKTKISIHAPYAGCDLLVFSNVVKPTKFQSTHPTRGATFQSYQNSQKSLISIHAPYAGCDALFLLLPNVLSPFQSTHPTRGATSGLSGIQRLL